MSICGHHELTSRIAYFQRHYVQLQRATASICYVGLCNGLFDRLLRLRSLDLTE